MMPGEYRSSFFDLDCDDVGRPIRIVGRDRHNLDADNDGVGCE